MFHSDCISAWLKTNNTCPIDKVEWRNLRVADTTTKLILNEEKQSFGKIYNKFNKHNFDHKKYEQKIQPIKEMHKNGAAGNPYGN